MQNGGDMYGPFWLGISRFVIVLAVIAGLVCAKLITVRLMRFFALRSQRQAAKAAAQKDPRIIDNALAQIENLYNAFLRHEISAPAAVEQVSAVARETYDTLMNHRTRFAARYEIAARNLHMLSEFVEHTYPIEFIGDNHTLPDAYIIEVFTKARKVVESCR